MTSPGRTKAGPGGRLSLTHVDSAHHPDTEIRRQDVARPVDEFIWTNWILNMKIDCGANANDV